LCKQQHISTVGAEHATQDMRETCLSIEMKKPVDQQNSALMAKFSNEVCVQLSLHDGNEKRHDGFGLRKWQAIDDDEKAMVEAFTKQLWDTNIATEQAPHEHAELQISRECK